MGPCKMNETGLVLGKIDRGYFLGAGLARLRIFLFSLFSLDGSYHDEVFVYLGINLHVWAKNGSVYGPRLYVNRKT